MAESCKKCLGEFEELIKIDAGMRLRLQEINNEAHEYPAVCNNCFNILKTEINQGAQPKEIIDKELSLQGVQRPVRFHELLKPYNPKQFFRFGEFMGVLLEKN